MKPSQRRPRRPPQPATGREKSPGLVRIIGGRCRGRCLRYHGDPRTRPMKDRVREAVFDLLGPSVRHKLVLDLFAGTGALGLEALSRGASRGVFIERHFPTLRLIEENVRLLALEAEAELVAGSAFVWVQKRLPTCGTPWLAFCSPPYDFYVQRDAEMRQLIQTLHQHAPPESVLVVEADQRLDLDRLPDRERWSVRSYPPAVIALYY